MKITQEITPLNQQQLDDIKGWRDTGKEILEHYGVDKNISIYENLDAVYGQWLKDVQDKHSEDSIILGLGTIFGDRLLHNHGTSWKMITHRDGEDFAVILKVGSIYPIDFVGQRVYGEDTGFFSSMETIISDHYSKQVVQARPRLHYGHLIQRLCDNMK